MYNLYGYDDDKREKITLISKVNLPKLSIKYDNFSFEKVPNGKGIYLEMNIDLAKEVLNSQAGYYGKDSKLLCIYKEFKIPKIGDNWFINNLDRFLDIAYFTERYQNGSDIRSKEVNPTRVINSGSGEIITLNAHITKIEITSEKEDDDNKRIIYSAEF